MSPLSKMLAAPSKMLAAPSKMLAAPSKMLAASSKMLAASLSMVAMLGACGSDATLGDIRIDVCSDLASRTDGVELIVSRPEGFANSLPPGTSLENIDSMGPDELIWPIPEPPGGWAGDVSVHLANVIGNESVAARVTYGGGSTVQSALRPLSAGVRVDVCVGGADGGVIDDGGLGNDDGGLGNDAGLALEEVQLTNAGVGDSFFSSMISNGSELAIAWTDARDGNSEIYFARFEGDGTPIGSEVRVTNDDAVSTAPSLVWTGAEYGLAWHDERDGNSEIYFARLDTGGAVQGSPVRVSNDNNTSAFPSLAYNGSGFALAWEDNRDGFFQVYFTRLASNGVEIGDDVRLNADVDSQAAAPSLVWTGAEYGLAWQDNRDGDQELYFVRLDATGGKLIADARLTASGGFSQIPSLVINDGAFAVAWEDARDGFFRIFFVRISAAGQKLSTEVPLSPATSQARSADLLWTGTQYDLGWTDGRNGNDAIYAVAIDSDGLPIGESARVSNSDGNTAEPSLAHLNSQTSVVWEDSRDGALELFFQALLP